MEGSVALQKNKTGASGPTPGADSQNVLPNPQEPLKPAPRKSRLGKYRLIANRAVFSSLTQRIVLLNLAGLVVLVLGILYLNQFRDSLIEARVESLLTQGEIIAGAIAASATIETNAITIDPEKLLELQAGESTIPTVAENDGLEFPINPEQVAPVLRRLISPTRTRARIYDRDGLIVLDSLRLYSRGQILRNRLPPLGGEKRGILDQLWLDFKTWMFRRDFPLYQETPGSNGTAYSEVVSALTGAAASKTRRTEDGDTIVSVAVPVQRFRAVLGVLLLSTEAGDIDKILRNERLAIFRTFLVAAGVTLVLSILLASTIARPLRRLSAAAERVRLGVKKREEIPNFSGRSDEIGHLSTSLRDMTNSLYGRIEAIESFAADVSHELKNPLTSLRSAVETLPLVKNDDQKQRLLAIIEHDVRRLDRLISDISDASRLDAELAREDTEQIDLSGLVRQFHATYTNMAQNTATEMPQLSLKIADVSDNKNGANYLINGHPGRLGQVIANLVDNARSFVPKGSGHIGLSLTKSGNYAVLRVIDNGPGVDPLNTDKVFERFYTDRPGREAFGQNSGLGLSISRQIVEAHDGTLSAGNVLANQTEERSGAVFTLRLPLSQHGPAR